MSILKRFVSICLACLSFLSFAEYDFARDIPNGGAAPAAWGGMDGAIGPIPPALMNGLMQYEQAKWGAIMQNLPELLPAFAQGSHRAVSEFNGAFGEGMRGFNKEFRDGFKEFNDTLADSFEPGSAGDRAQGNFLGRMGHHTSGFLGKTTLTVGGIIVGVAALFFTIKYAIPYWFEKLRKPRLIIESSKKTFGQRIKQIFRRKKDKKRTMIFAPELHERLDGIAKSTRSINKKIKKGKKNVTYRNLMLYGPPGTGKTMFAKELARQSGLDYAIMSGSSFAKFKDGEGINELDMLFSWARKSKKGVLIFIDEAETFLSRRDGMDPNSKAYLLLNNFLNHTGERSRKVMIVFATNYKNGLDSALYRRIDDLVKVPLPGVDERIRLVQLYRDTLLFDSKQNGRDFVEAAKQQFDDAVVAKVAEQTEGLSGGDIESIINSIKTDADVREDGLVTQELIDTVVARAVKKQNDFTVDAPCVAVPAQ